MKKMHPLLETMLPIKRWLRLMEESGKADEAWQRIRAWEEMIEKPIVKTEKQGHVGIITLNYPEKGNALVPPMFCLFAKAIRELSSDDEIRAIIVTGTGRNFSTGGYVGPNAFYAGLDAGRTGTWLEGSRRTFKEMFLPIESILYKTEQPTIVALNGPVMAESVDIPLAADIRIGHTGSDFWFSFIGTGNTAYTGAFWLLPRIVGMGKASELLLMAKRISGEEAYKIGLLNFLVPADKLMEEALAVANKIASLPPISARLTKIELQRGQGMADFDYALEMSSAFEAIVQSTEDHMESEHAIMERRTPTVRGR